MRTTTILQVVCVMVALGYLVLALSNAHDTYNKAWCERSHGQYIGLAICRFNMDNI